MDKDAKSVEEAVYKARIWNLAKDVVAQAQPVRGGGYYIVPDYCIDRLSQYLYQGVDAKKYGKMGKRREIE